MMNRIVVLIFVSFICGYMPVNGQALREFESGYYAQPLTGSLLLSANFAETRTNHLHSGIDIKVGGVEGAPLYAVADGYIARIGVIPSGFGRVLYIAHPNGTTSVYAHQQKFTPDIEAYVDSERYRLKLHRIDLYLNADKFPVKKGQLIGYAGNSGRSFGPHLHFEIRETASQRILNVPKLGVYTIKDDILPTIVKLHYIETDTISGVPVYSKSRALEVGRSSEGIYGMSDPAIVEVGKNGYFVLEATDRKNNTQNTMGIYSVRMTLDEQPIYAFHLNSFLFSQQRYVNSLTHYAMQRGSRNELLRLALESNNKLPIYSEVKNSGVIRLTDNDIHRVKITVEDDNKNISHVSLNIKKRSEQRQTPTPSGIPVDYKRSFTRSVDGATVTIPASTLYESIFYTQTHKAPTSKQETLYSPIHSIHSDDIPLHLSILISIDVVDLPENLRIRACLASVSADGQKYSYAGGSYADGKVTAAVRSFGDYCVMVDTTPPTLKASFADNADLRGASSISFTFDDNLSGVASFTANIDGQWIAFEQQGSTITHFFDPKRITYSGDKHLVILSATDNKGNTSSIKRNFTR